MIGGTGNRFHILTRVRNPSRFRTLDHIASRHSSYTPISDLLLCDLFNFNRKLSEIV